MKIGMSLMLLLAASALNAACPTLGSAAYSDVCGIEEFNCSSGDALSFISIAFMLVSLLIGLAYMYSKLRQDERIGVWAKDEAANLLITVLLFSGILLFFTGSCKVAEGFSGGNPFGASQGYIRGLLQSNGLSVTRDLTARSISDQMEATYYLYIGMPPVSGSGSAGRANMRAHSALKEFLIDLYIPIIASLNAQLYILQAIQWVGASILLPFAFVLRIIPATREFGNVLIALFFGLYIVVPAMYAVGGKIFEQIMAQPVPDCVDCSLNMFRSYGLDSPATQTRETVFYQIGSMLPQAIFLPNLVIIVAVTCVMSLSKALRAMAV